jgi:glycolate oxidase FAD binding subunit
LTFLVMNQIVDQLAAQIREAAARRTPLRIVGGGSKDFYGGPSRGETLSISAWRGIVEYDPSELVITARAGTPLSEIEATLREKRQMLAFEPPHFGSIPSPLAPLPSGEGNVVSAMPTNRIATIGGCIAAGLSGPRRASTGAVRDFVLGVRILDGNGAELRFGGRVMKNVAGYDISRLMAGSLGTLGVILEASLKVLPLPPSEKTLRFKCAEAEALARMNEWGSRPLPVSATAYREDELCVRLSGSAAAVEAAVGKIGGAAVEPQAATDFWRGIREQTDQYFAGARPLWRLAVKSTTPPIAIGGSHLIEWGGALRWLRTEAPAQEIRALAARAGGHATLFRSADKSAGVFQTLPAPLMKIQRELKRAFDPAGIFNPERMYPEF